MQEKIKVLASELQQEVVSFRRHLHAHPELSFHEFETSKYIAAFLDKHDIPYQGGYVKTGLVAHIKGRNPEKRTIALRADMDALPIVETNDVSYKSQNEGVMHACGHDVHSSSMMGVAMILNEIKDNFEGTVKIVFQPGEEVIPGGASLMIKENALKDPDAELMIGQHVYPQLPAGEVGFKKGVYMASADELHVTVKGKGGHAALPHTTVDPILIASHIVVALQQIVSRNCNPITPSVLSFGKIEGLGATNIIPDEVKLAGTFRTFDEDFRAEAKVKMKKLAESIAEGMGGSCDFIVADGFPFLVNDDSVTDTCWNAANEYLGKDKVKALDLRMTSEDFAYYSHILPSCFYRLGVTNPSIGKEEGLHTSTFDIDETALETSIGLMSWMAINLLATKSDKK
ncbi:MAG: amidohydrolase [Glaciecola sp.]|jgi:amidohydrolase